MKTWESSHNCPLCGEEVVVEYDCGRGPEDFYMVTDPPTCEEGHEVTDVATLRKWEDRDMEEYGREEFERYEEAREAYWERKGEGR